MRPDGGLTTWLDYGLTVAGKGRVDSPRFLSPGAAGHKEATPHPHEVRGRIVTVPPGLDALEDGEDLVQERHDSRERPRARIEQASDGTK